MRNFNMLNLLLTRLKQQIYFASYGYNCGAFFYV